MKVDCQCDFGYELQLVIPYALLQNISFYIILKNFASKYFA